MSYLLHINTALENAHIGLSDGQQIIAARESVVQKEHGAFLQPAIKDISLETGIALKNIAAVSVVNGPGSYTGLRVGLSAAKGICFALNKPLICISTLEWLAHPFYGYMTNIICPMIDARRMEVFTAMYNPLNLAPVSLPQAMIIDENSFPELENSTILFTGNGRNKLPARISTHANSIFPTKEAGLSDQANMANLLYTENKYSNLAYTEPFYLKSFYTTSKKT
ncbi:MAG TPA: tRNA (adenosine(37)-N6)-threonylcarbamoyltransferase complex dimerization subunit type 1 TsaB [Chitinophagaceae bacterium]|nr:tRNA (adenosine(37)-N6)-threonylcarbamoyltransferase complex dimerization subunit type 1 TsaB [Chitinophagaceae bacterium]